MNIYVGNISFQLTESGLETGEPIQLSTRDSFCQEQHQRFPRPKRRRRILR